MASRGPASGSASTRASGSSGRSAPRWRRVIVSASGLSPATSASPMYALSAARARLPRGDWPSAGPSSRPARATAEPAPRGSAASAVRTPPWSASATPSWMTRAGAPPGPTAVKARPATAMCRSRTIVPAPASVRPASSPIALTSVLRMDGNRIAGADGKTPHARRFRAPRALDLAVRIRYGAAHIDDLRYDKCAAHPLRRSRRRQLLCGGGRPRPRAGRWSNRRDRRRAGRAGAGEHPRRAAAQPRRGVPVRARPAVRDPAVDALASPQEARRGRPRRGRAPPPMGLLLAASQPPPGADRMADVTTPDPAPAQDDIREGVREKYAVAARAATDADGAAGGGAAGVVRAARGCGRGGLGSALYEDAAAEGAPPAAVSASLGCGVPTAVADLHAGETVLDLGSGAGADVLISARRVGASGRAIGLDMPDEMLELARANAAQAGVGNVEFVKGYLEDIPLPDASVDVVISNCVINLAGDKAKALGEAARVLRPGGRLAVSDVIADPDMDEATRSDMAAYTGCIAGALTEQEFRAALSAAGLTGIEIRETHRVHERAASAIVRARKPSA